MDLAARISSISAERETSVSARRAILLGSAIVGLLFLFCGRVLWEGRSDAWEAAGVAEHNLVRAITQGIDRNIESYDLSLQAVVDGLKEPTIWQISPHIRHLILFDRSAMAKGLGDIRVLDESGHVVELSGTAAPPAETFLDREYFQVHKARSDLGTYISAPFRLHRDGQWAISLSRRISHPDGSFAGVVVGKMRLSYFQDLFESLALGKQGSINLFRTDGILIARYPYIEDDVGHDLGYMEVFRRLKNEPSGQFVTTAVLDGVRRLYVYRQIGQLPLVVSVGLATDDIEALWRRKAAILAVFLAGLAATVMALSMLLGREFWRRLRAEREARQSEQQYRLVSENSSDGIVLRGLDGVRRYSSPAFYQLIGRSQEEVGQRGLAEFLHPDFAAKPGETFR